MIEPPLATAPAEDDGAFDRPLFEAFAEIATRQPDHVAVDDGTAQLSYGDLRNQALALGARVAALVPVDGLVGVFVPTTVLYPVAWLACLAARRAFLPLDPHLPPARNQAIVAKANLAAVIVPAATANLAAPLPSRLTRIPMTTEHGLNPAPPPPPPNLPPAKVGPEKVGMVMFTSGSTGGAKGIALHERSQLRKAISYRETCALGPADGMLLLRPPTTTGGAGDTFGALLSGTSLHLVDLKRDGLGRALAVLQGGGITVCAAVPVVARTLIAMAGAADAFRTLRIVRLGGDAVLGSDIAALARLLPPTARILVGFGMTETGGTVAQRLIDPRAPVETGRVAVGRPMPGQIVSVEDASGNPVRPGETGRVVTRGRYIALGHWVAGRLDPTAFPADPSTPGSRCFRSDDVVLLRPDGMLVPVGRADRQVKINGIRVEPGDTEAALRGLPGVADAAVIVHGDAAAPMLVAFVVPTPPDNPTKHPAEHLMKHPGRRHAEQFARRLRSALVALLPPQEVPARIRVLSAIPLLPSLKPDLAALRALLAAEDAPGMFAGVRTWLRGGRPDSPTVHARPAGRRNGAAP